MSDAPPPLFPDLPLLGRLPIDEQADLLRELGDTGGLGVPAGAQAASAPDGADARGGVAGWLGLGPPRAWQHTANQLGYIAPVPPGTTTPVPVVYPGNVAPDASLKDSRINIHLGRLGVFDYPGSGEHLVLVTFKAQNQLPTGAEPVSFSQAYRVRAGQQAGVIGYPLCLGLSVGRTGAAFQFNTVNVKDSTDEATVHVLESPTFTAGLNLLTVPQPALKPLTDLALGLARQFATRNRNKPVQDCYLGLDFGSAAFGARLAVGSYVVVQVPGEGTLRWEEWEYHPNDGVIRNTDGRTPIEFNYLVFQVSRYEA